MEAYEIRIALKSDGKTLVQFLDTHWMKDHVFVKSRMLLDWQHYDAKLDRYNFVIGVEKISQEIHGILGFITLSQFAPQTDPRKLCWMAIWKVQEAARGRRLGRRLMDFLTDTIEPEIISTVAASEMTLGMYKAKGYRVGEMTQHYILNPNKSDFQLVKTTGTNAASSHSRTDDSGKSLVLANETDISKNFAACFVAQNCLPVKSREYFINRYLRHPVYQYQAYMIRDKSGVVGIVISRVCSHRGAKAIRIVDYSGPDNALQGLSDAWKKLLQKSGAEFIDFYSAGISHEDIEASGFLLRERNGDVVIPNYFEPFEQKNVEINYMTSAADDKPFRIVKGDSDQDRPNFIKDI